MIDLAGGEGRNTVFFADKVGAWAVSSHPANVIGRWPGREDQLSSTSSTPSIPPTLDPGIHRRWPLRLPSYISHGSGSALARRGHPGRLLAHLRSYRPGHRSPSSCGDSLNIAWEHLHRGNTQTSPLGLRVWAQLARSRSLTLVS